MLPLLSLHSLVAHRGDGLRPELLALLQRQSQGGLSVAIEPDSQETQQERPQTSGAAESEPAQAACSLPVASLQR